MKVAHSRNVKSTTLEGTPDIDENLNQRLSFLLKNNKGRQCKTPSSSSRIQMGFNPDPNFSKIMPKEIRFDKERLLEENESIKSQVFEISEENTRLKTKLLELLSHQDKESNKNLSKLKRKVRDFQNLLHSKDDEIFQVLENIKSSKVFEKENEIASYITEASRLKFLIEKLCTDTTIDPEHFQETAQDLAIEIQTLKKENIHLNNVHDQSQQELLTLKQKLDKLEHKKDQELFKKKIKKYSKIREKQLKTCEDQSFDLSNQLDSLRNMVKDLEKQEASKIQVLEKNDLKIMQQDQVIKEMKEKLDKDKLIRNRRNHTFMPSTLREQISIKQVNPPRLLVKLNQILKRKKMLISVFLSLLDKNNNGQVHSSLFVSGLRTFGKKIKKKHMDEIFNYLGNSHYVELNKLEDLYEKYRYEDQYQSSTDEEVNLKRPVHGSSPSHASPSSPSSPSSPNNQRRDDNRKPSVKEKIISLEPVIISNEKIVDLTKAYQIKDFLDEVREKMIQLKMHKGKTAFFLFGNNFDPDEDLQSDEVEVIIKQQLKDFQSENLFPLVAKFLIEPEIGTFKESAYKKLKGNLRNGCRKLLKHLKDWEIFNDLEVAEFEASLKAILTLKYDKIMKIMKKNEGKNQKFSEFLEILEKVDASFSERMISWVMFTYQIKEKTAEFDGFAFMQRFKSVEPIFAVKPSQYEEKFKNFHEKTEVFLDGFIEKIANVLKNEPSLFPRGFLSFSSDDFIHFFHDLGILASEDELAAVWEHFSNARTEKMSRDFDPERFLIALKKFGFIPDEEPGFKSSRSFDKEFIVIQTNEKNSLFYPSSNPGLNSEQLHLKDESKESISSYESEKNQEFKIENSKIIKNYEKQQKSDIEESFEEYDIVSNGGESDRVVKSQDKNFHFNGKKIEEFEVSQKSEKFEEEEKNEFSEKVEKKFKDFQKIQELNEGSFESDQEICDEVAGEIEKNSGDEENKKYEQEFDNIEEDIEEGKNQGDEGETSLEFEEYGIRIINS